MPHEAIGEIVVGLAEVGFEVAASGDKKPGWGCFIFIVLIIGLAILGYYYL